ncbi:adenosylmethionine--8-amino-7-oxononanoate transaminase [Chitinimonas sp. BJB300]|uniref:adenosylmethionine--8-amino-7-oxononanoate transaminase n=1 Tax=Chitinimonas sp. BJB300 TaxID=1559339 RepID=UPI000C115DDC|nr:adenosylmethionine--8-amino-7-oxononanoate transaminase [Chitinimonas sp. BJB300]PHV11908.1 adenosylmethionine--8-amino-7-oxononanoate transaminase [Chitinimonas sp. BJB300]TSJ91486.1 adenosylmethionine--8-amino-7-oxononanoate transaminase [Chitinimonas sp. BJB300]
MQQPNQDWLARSRRAVWHPCTQMKKHEQLPIVPIARGEGAWLVDFEGRRFLDGVSSWWVNLFGHANPRINAALVDQMNTLEHVILAGFTQKPVVELSEQLGELTGLGHAFYGSDGASATEIALKMSYHYWRNHGQDSKTGFVSLQNSYHGETLGALSVTDVPLFSATYAPLLRQTHRVMSPDWRLAEPGENAEAYARRAADSLEALFKTHAADLAAFIVEPLCQGAAGMAMYHPAYLHRARALCNEYKVHLIADEIAVGFGRTGTLFACEQADIKPDFICLSKGITGGYLPLSAVLTTDEIYAAFYADDVSLGFLHSHSYTGNALACRAALEVLQIFKDNDVLATNRQKATTVAPDFAHLTAHPRVKNARQLGMIWAFDVIDTKIGFAGRLFEAALARGVLLRPINNTIYLMPPYVVTAAELKQVFNTLLALLDEGLS